MSGRLPENWGAVEDALAGDETLALALKRLLDQAPEADPARFAELVDASDHSPRDWAEALAAFDAWLADRGVAERPFDTMCGYLQCCATLSPPTVSTGSLKVLLIEALTEFGFDFINNSQI